MSVGPARPKRRAASRLERCVMVISFFFVLLLASPVAAQRHPLTCAIIQAPSEYTLADLHGPRVAFDLELCRAVAAALQTTVVPVPVMDETAAVRALRDGQADLVPTLSADLTHLTDPALLLAPPILEDAVGLLVPASTSSLAALAGGKICFLAGSEAEVALHTYFRLHQLDFLPYPFSEEGEMQAALTSGTCPAMAGDLTRLAAVRSSLHRAAEYKLLSETLAPDPLASATRRTDPALFRAVVAVEQFLLNASMLNLSAGGAAPDDTATQRLLGHTHELGPAAGLDDAWPLRVLQATGNYTQITGRTLPLHLPAPPAAPLK